MTDITIAVHINTPPSPVRRGVVYVVDAVEEARRRIAATGDLPLTLLVTCETGAVACAIASAALSTAGIYISIYIYIYI